jgi:hypothetical protein
MIGAGFAARAALEGLPTKLLIALAVAAACAAGGAFAAYKFLAPRAAAVKDERDRLAQALDASEKQRKADAAVLTRRSAANAAAARESARKAEQLEDALERNRAWADQPVPKDVQDALR